MHLYHPDCRHRNARQVTELDGIVQEVYAYGLFWQYRAVIPLYERCNDCGKVRAARSAPWLTMVDYFPDRLRFSPHGTFMPILMDGIADADRADILTAIVTRSKRHFIIIVNLPVIWLIAV